MISLSVVILNWNSKELLRQCLRTLFAFHSDAYFEVIVIDGGSYDGCGDMIKSEFRSVEFIQLDRNVGFAKANNIAALTSKSEFILFLNPDTEFRGPVLNHIMDCLRDLPKAGVVGCQLRNTDGTVQTTCVQPFPTILNRVIDSEHLRRQFPKWRVWGMQPLRSDKPTTAEAISGACMAIPRDVFLKAGCFTEQYFMYTEDVDLCFKVKNLGYNNYYTSRVSVIHHGGGSSQQSVSNFSSVMLRESTFKFFLKHRGFATAMAFRAATSLNATLRIVALYAMATLFHRKTSMMQHIPVAVRKWSAILKWSLTFRSTQFQPK